MRGDNYWFKMGKAAEGEMMTLLESLPEFPWQPQCNGSLAVSCHNAALMLSCSPLPGTPGNAFWPCDFLT